jgi:ribonuclease M5
MDEIRRLRIPYPIIVEGRYDRQRLQSICDGQIYTTDGFGIFKKGERLALFRELSRRTPIIILTDSDGAGKLIRSHLTSAIPADRLIQRYIPKIKGKEKRKAEPSAEGTLGVEGMERDLLFKLLEPYEGEIVRDDRLSKTDFYFDGLSGGDDSREKRAELCRRLGLPEDMTANALLEALKILISYEEYCALVGRNSK